MSEKKEKSIDPFKLLSTELKRLRLNVVKLIETKDQINLNRVSSYYLSSSANGKMLRPLIVLLISAATTTSTTPLTTTHPQPSSRQIDEPYSPLEILNDFSIPIEPSSSSTSSAILPSQIRLAEITEMIHVASLLHDDVIDLADQRRGQRSSPAEFGNKLSILAGDFLLSRSSVLLSRIGNHQVTELIATAISNLVQGELIQFDQAIVNDRQNYLRKTYLKTASLMAKTARSTVILSHDPIIHQPLIESVYQFAKNLGLAFQIVDDILDYTGSVEVMGKPSNGSDLKLGLITAPTLYAWLEHPELGELIRRRFKNQGDVELVQSIVISSGAIPSSYRLAQGFIDRAKLELIKSVKPSEFRSGLENLCDMVINRQK
ncbi:isoprenoid synthase domain-containing protein [Phakopsora pachyrhizi]|nr:isoprenoid synthase domain-containing protein [Phakopsora pachyrhizi]